MYKILPIMIEKLKDIFSTINNKRTNFKNQAKDCIIFLFPP